MANKKVYVAVKVSAANPVSKHDNLKQLLTGNLTEEQRLECLGWKNKTIYCIVEVQSVSKWAQYENDDDDTDYITNDFKEEHKTETFFINEYLKTQKADQTYWAYLLGDVIWLRKPVEIEEHIQRIQSLEAKTLRKVIQDPTVAEMKTQIKRCAIITVDRFVLASIKNKSKCMEIRSTKYRVLDPTQKYDQGDNWQLQVRGIEADIVISVVDDTFRNIYIQLFNNLMPQLTPWARKIFNEIGINKSKLDAAQITMDDVKKYVNVEERASAANFAQFKEGRSTNFEELQLKLQLFGEIQGQSMLPEPSTDIPDPNRNIPDLIRNIPDLIRNEEEQHSEDSEEEDEFQQIKKKKKKRKKRKRKEIESDEEEEQTDDYEEEDEEDKDEQIKKKKKKKKKRKRKEKETDPYRLPFKKRKLTEEEEKTDTSNWNPSNMVPVGGGDREIQGIPVIFPKGGPKWRELKFYCPLTSKYKCGLQAASSFDKHWYGHQVRNEIDDEYAKYRPEIFNCGCMCKHGCLAKKGVSKGKRGVWVSESSWITHIRKCIEASPEAAPNQAHLPKFAQLYPHHEDVDQYDEDKAAKKAAKEAEEAEEEGQKKKKTGKKKKKT